MYTITRGPSKLVTQRRTAWQEVEQQLGDDGEGASGQGPVQYTEKTPNPELKNFVPIDLDEWWAQRFLANIDSLS
ncbi:MAPK regulated corepressor interacting protein 2-like isoform X3 [Chanos chanos]|uniref:MAPK regulated corepressor interacting protein 2-like isoform X3 n=1 Tax=Chanos chanos TaxID=29144 RepID=A0A6J2WRP5_CHACN|nr:MAPK regulated corepressor interacting protein 2-like isoform X3 [Chanos chanos]